MNRSYDVLFEMDADLSHNPEYIPVFLAEIDKGYDVVIGSRYVKGGAIDGWNKIRKTISWLGNIFARNVAGIKLVQDCTSGFRAIRTDILHKAKFENLKSMGYSFQIEFLNRLIKAGAKVKEVPIVFKDRKRGRTKLGAADIVEFMADSIKIRLGR